MLISRDTSPRTFILLTFIMNYPLINERILNMEIPGRNRILPLWSSVTRSCTTKFAGRSFKQFLRRYTQSTGKAILGGTAITAC